MHDQDALDQLLDELISSGRSPEEVCPGCPELLPEVRRRWRKICDLRGELDALFPATNKPDIPSHGDALSLPQVPGYEVEAVVGCGGMGIVFRARHVRLNRLVALKMNLAGRYAGAREREGLQREAEAVAALRHPNIVQVYDVGDSGGRPYFTMEYLEGGSLTQKLTGAPLPAGEAAELLATLATAVHAAHSSGIIHRDLKPANVLLTSDGIPKVSDFGLARRLGGEAGLTRTGTAAGTPSYMAPEQARGNRDAVGPAADVYALGAILYELLTGRPPFRAESGAETIHQLLAQDPVPPSRLNGKVSRDLETICLKCLRKESKFRYPTAAALADDLGRVLRGEAIVARPEGPIAHSVRWVRRRPALSSALATSALAVAALIGGGTWLLSERAADRRTAGAQRAAIEQATNQDLTEMAEFLKKSAWPEARTALERAKARVGTGGPAELQSRLDRGERDLELVAVLSTVRLTSYERVDDVLDFTRADEEYEVAFHKAGLRRPGDPPEGVAARVGASDIRNALLAALDHWSACVADPHRKEWVLAVAARADGGPTGWRARARSPAIWDDETALFDLIKTAPTIERATPLLLAMELQSKAGKEIRFAFLKRVRESNPRDFWVNLQIAECAQHMNKHAEAVGYYQAAIALRSGVALVHNNLGRALYVVGRQDEAVTEYRNAIRLDPTAANAHGNLALALLALGRYDEAAERFPVAIRLRPNAAILYSGLGVSLERTGRSEEALAQHRRAVALDPKRAEAQRELRGILFRQGRTGDAQRAWKQALALDPPEHDAWDGYAELCLFLGQPDEYRRACRALLDRFRAGAEAQTAERIGRACLLAPLTAGEVAKAIALIDRALADKKKSLEWARPYYLYAKGLAEYRGNRLERAEAILEGEASVVLRPGPQLALALTQFRLGRRDAARKTLARAIPSFDWRAERADNREAWVLHALRREAEQTILPDMQAFLDGKHEPRDNDERFGLLGVCQFTHRSRSVAQLYADAFMADPQLADDFRTGHRATAARAAASAGCGRGADATDVGEPERTRWRAQARDWLWADMAAWDAALKDNLSANRDGARQRLLQWRDDPDFGGVRDPAAVGALPAAERMEYRAFWAEVDALLKRCESVK